jgi:hypothetical protein
MRAYLHLVAVLLIALSVSGFTPGIVIRLYNGTGSEITIAKNKSKGVTTIQPGQSRDFSPMYQAGERLLITTTTQTWLYSPGTLFPPDSLYQKHGLVWRAFARIDRHGAIYLLGPPADHGTPQQITQPKVFQ